jgi:hypothetical protein
MEPTATLTVSWQALTAIIGVLVIVVGMATGYLKLFMQTKLAELEKNILKQIKVEFQDKEISRLKEQEFEGRISKLEGKIFQQPLI